MNQINITPNCPPPSAFEKIQKYQNKLEEKCFYLNFDNNKSSESIINKYFP